ncbi:putative receptor protein kinase ZmPK1 [Rhododendron vialii]|uniref:putative receptor protein kinase ZmPK1 n=1 Tax=Rhododendron vialii TaxID=182163 RepID=UPI00265EFD92|nr:putative receptor protein kinase ZmPK1 [Rhododendron vialii]
MDTPILILLISLFLSSLPPLFSISSPYVTLPASSSLSVSDILISADGIFSAGFYNVGENAYWFSIWFTKPTSDGNLTVVWMANRDQPINGKRSKLSLHKSGNLKLTDAAQFTVWSTNTKSRSPLQLQLLSTGNLVLRNQNGSVWESFDSPTDTLLPNQPMTRNSKLVSSRSRNNFSSGFYSLFFDYDNILRLLFDGAEASSTYWPDPGLVSWEAGRTTYNNSQTAAFNSSGYFRSSDDFKFNASDYGIVPWRILKMDVDGNVRLYSLDEERRIWRVSWQAISQPCKIHGVCGPNAMCNYDHPGENAGRRCSCLPGYKAKNLTDWSLGCEPEFNLSCNAAESGFMELPHTEFYGYDIKFYENYTYEKCEEVCLKSCKCYGFNFKFDGDKGYYNCLPKSLLLNGYRSPSFGDPFYLKLPKASVTFYANRKQEIGLHCPPTTQNLLLDRGYKKPKQNRMLQFMVWFASAFGGFEIICICFVWLLLYKTQQRSSENTQSYVQVVSGFRKFTYAELKKATRNFREEIGRGGSGIVYKGVLSDRRVAAIKRLNEANQGAAEFLAEVSFIGRVNHMNLIEIWGYCVEGNHRLLVYEYMECGSLGENLISGTLDWEKRFDIAVGSARGLAYLHEECLEWVLHCDVKPQNILLDSNFQSKVADFGLSKLVNRGGGGKNSSFSRVRGTRGYMAPEWISNLPISSKVDVYSYGVVVMEMVTGKSPMTMGGQGSGNTGEMMEQRGLVKWVREKMNVNGENELWLEEIIDPVMKGKCDLRKMGILIQVALECVVEDKDARPTMSQVIERLLPH